MRVRTYFSPTTGFTPNLQWIVASFEVMRGSAMSGYARLRSASSGEVRVPGLKKPGARSNTTASMHSVKAGILLAFGDWHLDTMNGLTTFWSKHLNLSGRY